MLRETKKVLSIMLIIAMTLMNSIQVFAYTEAPNERGVVQESPEDVVVYNYSIPEVEEAIDSIENNERKQLIIDYLSTPTEQTLTVYEGDANLSETAFEREYRKNTCLEKIQELNSMPLVQLKKELKHAHFLNNRLNTTQPTYLYCDEQGNEMKLANLNDIEYLKSINNSNSYTETFRNKKFSVGVPMYELICKVQWNGDTSKNEVTYLAPSTSVRIEIWIHTFS